MFKKLFPSKGTFRDPAVYSLLTLWVLWLATSLTIAVAGMIAMFIVKRLYMAQFARKTEGYRMLTIAISAFVALGYAFWTGYVLGQQDTSVSWGTKLIILAMGLFLASLVPANAYLLIDNIVTLDDNDVATKRDKARKR